MMDEIYVLPLKRYSADELMDSASLPRLYEQRATLRRNNYKLLERNYEKSVFYQLDLSHLANDYSNMQLSAPDALEDGADEMQQIHNRMLRSRILASQGNVAQVEVEEERLSELLTAD